ncbi:sodium channel protein Nach [Scaptodrosophila lebanonensis]|uniref:Sodium channel protein Nach n=1 Tax=Drosophila lebanonensis TaxID=7225 RepID=A0A6J2UIZ7_DROLE|nr:sodium channel protein Nach [Scaptodrosophila lebanonensis]
MAHWRSYVNKVLVRTWNIIQVIGIALRIIFKHLRVRVVEIASQAGAATSLLAISLTVNRRLHPCERLLWLLILLLSIYTALMLSDLQRQRFLTSPTVISVDRDYRGWNGSLPAVTLCYYDHIDSFKANEFIQDIWNVSIVDEDYFFFMDFLYAVVNATTSNYADIAKYAEDERFDQIDLHEMIQLIDRPFEQLISSFDANFRVQVQQVMTERGLCYAINAPMAEVLNGKPVIYEQMPLPLSCQYGKQQCYIRMDLYESTGVIDVHSPFEVSATHANIIPLHTSDEITASFKVLETVASKNLRQLSVAQRKCVFNDEETSYLKIYSKSVCLARCRAIMALEMCNCVPFFYQFVDGPSCSPAGFECLLDFKWPIWALHICKCPSTCTEIEYTMQTVKKSSWGVKNNDDGMGSDTATSSFRWDLIPPKVRMRRDVVFSFEDLIVSFGGAMAFFVGVSVMGLVQMCHVILYNVLRDLFKLLRCILAYGRIFRQRYIKPPTISLEATTELPPFEYVN